MKLSEPYGVRLEMAKMHDEYIERLNTAMIRRQYVEASWLCYAIFEQRISRTIEKHLSMCPRLKRSKSKPPVGISTKIICLQKLCRAQYGPYADFDRKLLKEIKSWCEKRNDLIHGLVSLKHYKKYDREFKSLAQSGEPLVKRLYTEVTKVRTWCQAGNKFGKFPEIKCKCKEIRCICEEG